MGRWQREKRAAQNRRRIKRVGAAHTTAWHFASPLLHDSNWQPHALSWRRPSNNGLCCMIARPNGQTGMEVMMPFTVTYHEQGCIHAMYEGGLDMPGIQAMMQAVGEQIVAHDCYRVLSDYT